VYNDLEFSSEGYEGSGNRNLGVHSNFEGLHPMRDGMQNEALVDYYFGIIDGV
jgi:hypothetical protein